MTFSSGAVWGKTDQILAKKGLGIYILDTRCVCVYSEETTSLNRPIAPSHHCLSKLTNRCSAPKILIDSVLFEG